MQILTYVERTSCIAAQMILIKGVRETQTWNNQNVVHLISSLTCPFRQLNFYKVSSLE